MARRTKRVARKADTEAELEGYEGPRVYIATPTIDGRPFSRYVQSLWKAREDLARHGIPHDYTEMAGDSLVTRARNVLVGHFLMSKEFTHLMFIDCDIEFDPWALRALLQYDLDIVAGIYPKKMDEEEYVLNFPERHESDVVGGCCVEMRDVGTGFMMVHRRVFEKLIAMLPHSMESVLMSGLKKIFSAIENDLYDADANLNRIHGIKDSSLLSQASKFMADVSNAASFDDLNDESKKLWREFFVPDGFVLQKIDRPVPSAVTEGIWPGFKENYWNFFGERIIDGEHLSEDYAFCRLWQEIGGKCFADVRINLNHVGTKVYPGAVWPYMQKRMNDESKERLECQTPDTVSPKISATS